MPSPTPQCSSYWKRSLLVALDHSCQLYLLYLDQSGPGRNDNEGVFHIPESSIFRLFSGTRCWERVLCFCRNAAGIFFTLSWQGYRTLLSILANFSRFSVPPFSFFGSLGLYKGTQLRWVSLSPWWFPIFHLSGQVLVYVQLFAFFHFYLSACWHGMAWQIPVYNFCFCY